MHVELCYCVTTCQSLSFALNAHHDMSQPICSSAITAITRNTMQAICHKFSLCQQAPALGTAPQLPSEIASAVAIPLSTTRRFDSPKTCLSRFRFAGPPGFGPEHFALEVTKKPSFVLREKAVSRRPHLGWRFSPRLMFLSIPQSPGLSSEDLWKPNHPGPEVQCCLTKSLNLSDNVLTSNSTS